MREAYLFALLEKVRERLLQQAEACPVEKRDVTPAGFNNNVHWHLGHVLTVTEGIVLGLSGGESTLPETYRSLFGNGTKPSDWTDATPEWDTIVSQLKEQPQRLAGVLAGKMDQPAKENFANAENVGELLLISISHENNHLGSVNAMVKFLKS